MASGQLSQRTDSLMTEVSSVNVSLKQFLSCFYGENQTVFLRLIHDKKDRNYQAMDLSYPLNEVESRIEELKALNDEGYAILFSPNGARKDNEVVRISSCFFEADTIPIDQQWAKINAFPLQPSIVVRTRKSLHTYYRLKDGSVESFRRIERKLAQHFDGDKNIVNLSRYMRAPFFYHQKEDPFYCKCEVFEPSRVYTQAELESYLPQLEEPEPDIVPAKQGEMDKLLELISSCDFIHHCQSGAANLSEIDWYSMISNLAVFDGGRLKIHEFSKSYPGYDYRKTEDKIEHFINSGTGPVHCRTIAEKGGFRCPRLGVCKCQAPAGLPYTMTKVELQLPEWYKLDTKTKALKFMPGILAQYLTTNRPAIYSSGMFYSYKDGYYKEIPDISAQKIVQDHLIIDKSKMADISDATSQWRLMIEEDVNKINANRNLINLQNGLYNIKTRELMPHTPEALSTIRVNASYTPGAECPKFLEFLNSVLEPELIPVIKQMFGYCLTLRIDAEKTFMMRGIARSGKSTLIKIIENLVGQENCSNIPIQDLGERFKTSAIFGKLVNSYSDLPNKAILDSGVFKAICSGDLISGERKGKDIFNFRAFCKLIYSANELPFNAGDKTEGFFRRLIIIRFNKQIPEENVNPNLLEELLSEVDGILRWALEGLDVLITNRYRFPEPDAVKEEVSRYRYMSNNARAFVEDSCVVGLDYRVERQEFYDAYCKCCSSNGTHPMAMSKFTALIESDYHDRIVKSNDSVSRRGIWKGIKLNDETDTATRDVKEIYDNFLPF
jgi:P4 family phage/plasmid primase-like protien